MKRILWTVLIFNLFYCEVLTKEKNVDECTKKNRDNTLLTCAAATQKGDLNTCLLIWISDEDSCKKAYK